MSNSPPNKTKKESVHILKNFAAAKLNQKSKYVHIPSEGKNFKTKT